MRKSLKPVRRRLWWGIDRKQEIIKAFSSYNDRDDWASESSFRERILSTDNLIRKANRYWNIEGPCEIKIGVSDENF